MAAPVPLLYFCDFAHKAKQRYAVTTGGNIIVRSCGL